MTQKFRSYILVLCALFASSKMDASCPANYTTTSVTLPDGRGNNIFFSICYPSVVSRSINGGQFDIYLTIENTGTTTSEVLSLCSFVPFSPQFTFNTINVTQNPADLVTTDDGTSNVCTGSGRGQFRYASGGTNGIVAGGIAKATVTITANSAGSFSYNAGATAGLSVDTSTLNPTITVENTCPTITGSNATSATACTHNSQTGSLSNLVTGGASPYLFTTQNKVNGTVSVNETNGVYTFTPTIFTNGTGSFQYFATDVAGCTSNIGTITVPIGQSPSLPDATPPSVGPNLLYTALPGTPLTEPTNVTGGVPPYNYTVVGTPVNGNVTFNNVANTFTFTQTNNGASYFAYSVTDQNGCQGLDPDFFETIVNVFIYSCPPGYSAAAALDTNQNVLYTICYPPVAFVGTDFNETISMINLNTGTRTLEAIDFPLPDPSLGSAPGLSFVSNTPAPSGTIFNPFTPTGNGGMGEFIPSTTGGGIPGSTNYSVVASISANNTGPQSWTGNVPGNPALNLPINIQVNTCPTITASNASFTSCSNVLTGNLNPYVTGGTQPYTFSAAGIFTCTGAMIDIFGNFSYTAPTGFTGPCQIQYSVFDNFGCTSNIGTVLLSPNKGATALNGSAVTCENVPLSGTLAATGGVQPYTFAIVTNGTLGTAVITNPTTGTFTYTPLANMFGTDTFTFTVTDHNGCVSNIATETITINQNPTTIATGVSGCVGGTVTGNLTSSSTGGHPPYTFAKTGASVGGTVTVNPNGAYIFTGATGFSGSGGFNYQVTDGSGCIGTGSVSINLASPIAGSTAVSACVNGAVSGSLAGLVTGGYPGYTFGSTGSPVGGIVTVNPSGIFSFTASPGFSGPGSFGYQATDTLGCIGTGNVAVTIASPIASNTAMSTCNASLIGNLSPLVSGGSGPYTFSGPVGAITCTGGSVTISSSGIYNFTAPNTGTTGPCSFVYQVTDANTCTSTGQVTIKPNTSPIANSILLFTCADTPLSDTVANSVSDGVPPLTFTKVGTDVGGIATLNPDGSFIFTPTTGFLGDASFQYMVTDSSTPPCSSNVGTVTIEVENCCPAGPTGGFVAAMDAAIP